MEYKPVPYKITPSYVKEPGCPKTCKTHKAFERQIIDTKNKKGLGYVKEGVFTVQCLDGIREICMFKIKTLVEWQ